MKLVFPAAIAAALAIGSVAAADPAQTAVRAVAAFHAIDLSGTYAVDVQLGATQHLEIRGDAIDTIVTTVKDGTLYVTDPGAHVRTRGPQLTITMTALDAFALHGTDTVHATGLAAATLRIVIDGTAALALVGRTAGLEISVSGSGEIDASKLVARAVSLDVSGTASARLDAHDSFRAHVSGTASVRVTGHPPKVDKSVDGTAEIDFD